MTLTSSEGKVSGSVRRPCRPGGWLAALLSGALGIALAQEGPSEAPPQSRNAAPTAAPAEAPGGPEDLEPAVDTSAEPGGPEDLEPAVDTSAESGGPEDLEPAVDTSAEPGADARDPPAQEDTSAPASAARYGQATDRIELETTQITGNRELPKVLYIVPWKRSDLGDLVGKPVNSLLDEVLMPVDRDVFRRENRYYRALAPDVPRSGAAADVPPAPASPAAAGAEK